MGVTIRNTSTGVNLEYTSGQRRFVGRNTRSPIVIGDVLYIEASDGSNRETIVKEVDEIDALIDEVASTTIPVPATIQEVHDAIYFFFWRGIRFTGC